ncbi:MAG: response regulator [Desulfococcaceae bacterium]
MKEHILLVDDEPDILSVLRFALSGEGFAVETASNGKDALSLFQQQSFELVLSDIRMPEMDGLELLRCIKEISPDTEVIILTGYASVENAVQAMKNGGAFDFLQKPPEQIEELLRSVHRALEHRKLRMENRKTHQELEKSERFSTAILNSMPAAIVVLNPQGQILKTNRAWEKFSQEKSGNKKGISVGDSYVEYCRSIVNREADPGSEYAANALSGLQKVMAGEKKWFEMELPYGDKAQENWCLLQVFRLNVCEYQTAVSHTDITRLKQMEKRVLHSQKTDAIATLAGGIAHEFNNALNGLTGYAELLAMSAGKNEKTEKCIWGIRSMSERMSGLSAQLMTYARGGIYQPRPFDLNRLVETGVHLIRGGLPARIQIKTDTQDRENLSVNADLTQLHTVLSALVENASEAIEGEGCIRISVSREKPDGISDLSEQPETEKCIWLTVEDNGMGMDEKTRGRIFEPFFSTKFIGRGLGMSAVYGIVRNHGGKIFVDSEPARGTRVSICFPAAG